MVTIPGFHFTVLCCVQLLQSCPTVCSSMDCSPPGSSLHEISQARIMEWVAMPSFRVSSQPGIEARYLVPPSLAGGVLYHSHYLPWPRVQSLVRELRSYKRCSTVKIKKEYFYLLLLCPSVPVVAHSPVQSDGRRQQGSPALTPHLSPPPAQEPHQQYPHWNCKASLPC